MIAYTPLGGEAFARRLLKPVGLETVSLLYQSGYGFERLFRLFVDRMNRVENPQPERGFDRGSLDLFRSVVRSLSKL